MFRKQVAPTGTKGEATVFISGAADFTRAAELLQALSEALDACRHLNVDVCTTGPIDPTLRVVLCSLHRRSELMNKSMSVRVADSEGNGSRPRYTRIEGCLFKDASDYCSLWDCLIGR